MGGMITRSAKLKSKLKIKNYEETHPSLREALNT
jgi:hypothetical protein